MDVTFKPIHPVGCRAGDLDDKSAKCSAFCAGVIFFALCYFPSIFSPAVTSKRVSEPIEMSRQPHLDLSRRERQIIDILYARGSATAAEVQAALPEPPSYSAVRAMLRILEEKGHARHEQDGPRYIYKPTLARNNASKSAIVSRRACATRRSNASCRSKSSC